MPQARQLLHCNACGRFTAQNANVLHRTASKPFEAWHLCADDTYRQPDTGPGVLRVHVEQLAQTLNTTRHRR